MPTLMEEEEVQRQHEQVVVEEEEESRPRAPLASSSSSSQRRGGAASPSLSAKRPRGAGQRVDSNPNRRLATPRQARSSSNLNLSGPVQV